MISWRLDRNRLLDLRLLVGMSLPVLAGLCLFGWRAAGTIFLVCAGAIAARWIMNRLQTWPVSITRMTLLTRAILLAMFIPPTWFDVDQAQFSPTAHWPMAIAAGVILMLVTWTIARLGTARFSSIPVTLLIVIAASGFDLSNDRVLAPVHLLNGDLLSEHVTERSTATAESWLNGIHTEPVILTSPAESRLEDYLRPARISDRPPVTIARLLSDDLPPLEDLVVLGHPRSIGNASALAIIIGGLFMVHRRMVAFRLPAVMIGTAVLVLAIMPMPVVSGDEISRSWLIGHDTRVGWAIGITFLNYLLVASPLLLVTFFISMQPGIRPLSIRAGMIYAVVTGCLSGVLIATFSVAFGPILATAITQMITPTLDRIFPRQPL